MAMFGIWDHNIDGYQEAPTVRGCWGTQELSQLSRENAELAELPSLRSHGEHRLAAEDSTHLKTCGAAKQHVGSHQVQIDR